MLEKANSVDIVQISNKVTSLREKREKHKKDLNNLPGGKIDLDVQNLNPDNKALTLPVSPTELNPTNFGDALQAAWCDKTEGNKNKNNQSETEIEIKQVVLLSEEAKKAAAKKEDATLFLPDSSQIEIPHKDRDNAPTLFDACSNEEENEKMSLASMFEHLNQYIYVFCKFYFHLCK